MQTFTQTEAAVVVLKHPILQGSETITELNLTPPKAKHFRGLPLELDMDALLMLAGKLTGHAPSVLDELSFEDFQTLLQRLTDFLHVGQPTGQMPSV